MKSALAATPTIDSDDARVIAFAKEHSGGETDPRAQAVRLYYAVRDGIRYDPYALVLTIRGLKASRSLELGRAWCVPKAIVLAAACRALGIPARLGFADVKNHLSTERMRQTMKTDVFYWHGYTAIELGGQWVKATPAFNIELCQKFRMKPLEFDGFEDSIYHPFDLDGHQHMEYLRFHGEFDDLPFDRMINAFATHYGREMYDGPVGDFDREVAEETRDEAS
jgi:hypothetical protein